MNLRRAGLMGKVGCNEVLKHDVKLFDGENGIRQSYGRIQNNAIFLPRQKGAGGSERTTTAENEGQ
jgi:hypothetical protein